MFLITGEERLPLRYVSMWSGSERGDLNAHLHRPRVLISQVELHSVITFFTVSTSVGVRQQKCQHKSLRSGYSHRAATNLRKRRVSVTSSARRDSNPRKPVPKTGAIATKRLAGLFCLLLVVSTSSPSSDP